MTIQDKIAEIIAEACIYEVRALGCDEPVDSMSRYDYVDNILSLPIMRKCDKCGGSGNYMSNCADSIEQCKECGEMIGCKDGKKPIICPTCKGAGEVPEMHEVECPCKLCDKRGSHINCQCKSTGKTKRPKTLKDLIEEK